MSLNKTVQFKVNGMHCGGCANKIKKSLADTQLEHTIDINVEEGSVKISFDSEKGTIAMLKDGITKVGFQVEKIELQ